MDRATILTILLVFVCAGACWLYTKWITAERRDLKRLHDLPPVTRTWLTEQETRRRG